MNVGIRNCTAATLIDTCGEWGFSLLSLNASMVVQNDNTMILNDTNLSGPLTFYRVRPFDGTFESWIATLGLFGADAGPNAKPFADGLPNMIRYALNLSASSPAPGDLPLGEVVEISDTRYLTMEFRVRKDLHGATLTPQVTTTMDSWDPVPAENIERLADDDLETARYVARMPLSDTALFLRLAATAPVP